MGYEGFSRPIAPIKMHPITGNRGEFLLLLVVALSVPLIMSGRKQNEEALRGMTKTTNRYAELALDDESRQPSKWNC